MIDVGDTHRISALCTDSAGNPVDPSTATCTVTLPDGTTATPAVTLPPAETGRLVADIVTTQAGRHTVVITTTGPAWVFRDVFNVGDFAATALVSLRDAKEHLNLPLAKTTGDDELRGFIVSATSIVEHNSTATIPRDVVQRVIARGPTIVLAQIPIIEVISIEHVGGGTAYAPADLDIDPAGFVSLLSGANLRSGRLKVTYRAGYTVIPQNRLQAALIIIAHFWETQRANSRRLLPSERDMATVQDQAGRWFSIPRKAVELLESDYVPGVS